MPGHRHSAVKKRSPLAQVQTRQADPVRRHYSRAAASWRQVRCQELSQLAGGYLGTGPSLYVAQSARATSDAMWIRSLADGCMATDPDRAVRLLETANRIEGQARTHDMAAYEVAMKEGKTRIENEPARDLASQLR